jgi:hypothetical protein
MIAPMIFCNTAWMKFYRGDPHNDPPKRGGEWVTKHKWDHAMFNFLPFYGRYYGFVQTRNGLKLERLGAPQDAERQDGVTVVWTATSPSHGSVIVGWYKNAVAHHHLQEPAPGAAADRSYKGEAVWHHFSAPVSESKLLDREHRVFRVPRRKKGGMGQSNVWYLDKPEHAKFRARVWDYIQRDGVLTTPPKQASKHGGPKQPDIEKRLRIERRAMKAAQRHYEAQGYSIVPVPSEKLGWDLQATGYERQVKVEVKGLSGDDILAELTPNEYAKMREHKESYELFVLTHALEPKAAKQFVFRYDVDIGKWRDETSGRLLNIQRVMSARVSA